MALLVYRLSLFFYKLAITIAAPFNTKAKLALNGRKALLSKIKQDFSKNTEPIIWFHCASLGEFEQGRPIIERCRAEYTGYKIMLTFFSPSGYEVRKTYDGADFIYYLPWDTKINAEYLIDITKPKLAIFVKYEFWYYYLKTLSDRKIPTLSVSSIFRSDQIYFKSIGKFNLSILKYITHFFVQNRASKLLLESHSISNVTVAGDTRFDRVAKIVSNATDLPLVERFKGDANLMVVGSCWTEDLEVLLPFINESELKFIIAPHEVKGKTQQAILNDCLKKTILYSKLNEAKGDEQVLVIDNIGLLSSLYRYGEFAYVGGAFGAGLHNILEAATYGIPVFFGNKNYQKFNEATDLIKLGGAVAVANETEFREQFNHFKDPKTLQIVQEINSDYVRDNTGATDKILQYCKKILT